MPSSYKKSELIELLTVLGLPASQKSTKPHLEADIRNHLSSTPRDAQLDSRLSSFVGKAAPPSDEEEETPAEDILKEKAEELTEKVGESLSQARATGTELAHTIKSRLETLRGGLSTVASVNWILLVAEYSTLVTVRWPRNVLGGYVSGYDIAFKTLATETFFYTLILLAPALLFSFVINFTKKNAIRRKKHVYTFDPILFGIGRFFTAAIYHFFYADQKLVALAAASGLTAALVGIYASVLQTP